MRRFHRTLLLVCILAATSCGRPSTERAGERHPWTVPHVLRIAITQELTNLSFDPSSVVLAYWNPWTYSI
jgi:hypothetical protein